MSDKKLQAKHLFFQTGLNKTQIAEVLNIGRRTLHYWIREGNWQCLKMSSEHMPSIIAENCYHILAHMTNNLLSERRLTNPPSPKEIDSLHKLTITINKLKSRAVLNENVEMFAYFLDKLKAKAPEAAETIAPFIDEYLAERASVYTSHVMPPGFSEAGYIPMTTENEASKAERNLDNHDLHAWDYEEYWTQQLSNLDKPEPAAETPTVVASPYAMERKNIADSQTMEEFEQFSLEELKDYASIYLAKKETLATSVKEKDVPSTPIASQRLRGSTIDASLKEKENMKEPIASQSLSGSTIVNDPEQQVSNEKQPETPQSIENQSMPSATPQKKNPCPQMRSRIMQQIPNQPA